jgi:hypothetical protein
MLPEVETNYNIAVQNSVTPSVNTTFILSQKELRYLSVWSDRVACSKIDFHKDGIFEGAFSGS